MSAPCAASRFNVRLGVDTPPLKEEDQYPANPESAYGWSKLMGEYESFLLEKDTGTSVYVFSLHKVYAAPTDYSEGRSQVIPSPIRKAIEAPEEEFAVWGRSDQGRACVHVDDVVEGIVLGLRRGMGHGVIQIGPDVCTSIREVPEMVVHISGKPIAIRFDPSKPEGDRGRCADYSKAQRVLGWSPAVRLHDGLPSLCDWIERQMRVAART
jgi:nucleoside-diphosphate-sugar epimerase